MTVAKKVLVTISRDKAGIYFLYRGKKYRIGKKVTGKLKGNNAGLKAWVKKYIQKYLKGKPVKKGKPKKAPSEKVEIKHPGNAQRSSASGPIEAKRAEIETRIDEQRMKERIELDKYEQKQRDDRKAREDEERKKAEEKEKARIEQEEKKRELLEIERKADENLRARMEAYGQPIPPDPRDRAYVEEADEEDKKGELAVDAQAERRVEEKRQEYNNIRAQIREKEAELALSVTKLTELEAQRRLGDKKENEDIRDLQKEIKSIKKSIRQKEAVDVSKLSGRVQQNLQKEIQELKEELEQKETRLNDILQGEKIYASEKKVLEDRNQELSTEISLLKRRLQEGRGYGSERGLSDAEIDAVMSKCPEYMGTISHNEIPTLITPKIKERSKGCFIINTDPRSKSGQHWQAVYYDATPGGENEIDFFDSYGDPIDRYLLRDIKGLAERLNSNVYLKLKENRIRKQNSRSSNCGWLCLDFLLSRLRGRPFKDASGYSDVQRGEASAEELKEKVKFGYVPSFGKGLFSKVLPGPIGTVADMAVSKVGKVIKKVAEKVFIRTDFPPPVKRWMSGKDGDTIIKSITVCRKPIVKGVDRALNLISLGGWGKAKAELGYADMFHLYMVLNGNVRLERNHVIEMYAGTVNGAQDTREVNLHGKSITFRELLEKTARLIGPNLQRYDGTDNNCQVFLTDVLRANGLLTPELRTWINQDAKALFEKMPKYVERISKGVTDLAHGIDTVIHGRKRKSTKKAV